MKAYEILLGIGGIALLTSAFAQRLLLEHVWAKDHAWASSERLPKGGLVPFGLGELVHFYALIICLHPKLRQDRYSNVMTWVCWMGTLPALVLVGIGVLLIERV